MSTIPSLDACRFITISQIKARIEEDNFKYTAVRVHGKVLKLQDDENGMCIFQNLTNEEDTLMIDTYLISKVGSLEVGKTYEMLGEI